MNEQWQIWEPIQGLAHRYRMKYINNNLEGLSIRLIDNTDFSRELLLFFEDGVDSYRFVKNIGRHHTLDLLAKDHGAAFFQNWTFFKVDHSHYKAWLASGSQGIRGDVENNLHHFVLITSNFMVDIVNGFEPQVAFIETNDK